MNACFEMTMVGIIHYLLNEAYIVPSRPKGGIKE